MRVMVIVKASKASEAGEMPSTQLLSAMMAFNEALVNAGIMRSGDELKPSSNGYRIDFGTPDRLVTRGPFAETQELIAGYWVWEVKDMEEALAWAKRCPNPHNDGGILELRPFFEMADFGDQATPELREQEAALRARTQAANGTGS